MKQIIPKNEIITPDAFFKDNTDFETKEFYKICFLKNHDHTETCPIINEDLPYPFLFIKDKDKLFGISTVACPDYFVIPSAKTNTTLVIRTGTTLSLDDIKFVIKTYENHENISPSFWKDNRLQIWFKLVDWFGTAKDHPAFLCQRGMNFSYNMNPGSLTSVRKKISKIPKDSPLLSNYRDPFPLTVYPDINTRFETHIKDMLFCVTVVSNGFIALRQLRPTEIIKSMKTYEE